MALIQDEEYRNDLACRVEHACDEGKFFVKVGCNLTGIIQGTVDPLGLMFESSLARDYYQDISVKVNYNMPISRYLDTLAHKNPGMKIIEIGAGTGGMTSHVMKVLISHGEDEVGAPRYAQYDYTDISRSFFQAAQGTFAEQHKRLKFSVLDIKNDPTCQGFQQGTYDLVITTGVSRFLMSIPSQWLTGSSLLGASRNTKLGRNH